MSSSIRRSLVAAGFSAALALAGARPAQGQVFRGNFPVPHGRISVGVGVPSFAVGTYVPAPYANQVVYQAGYGYGFACDAGWVPVRAYGSRWIVTERPSRISRDNRDDRRFESRPFDRDGRYASNGRRDFDRGRADRRRGDRDRDDDRR